MTARARDLSRAFVWKHSCTLHGMGENLPCDPPCDDPWQVDLPIGLPGGCFVTFEEALQFANRAVTK